MSLEESSFADRGWHVARFAAALVLFLAAGTKCHEILVFGGTSGLLDSIPLATILLVEGEWLGSILLSGNVCNKAAWACAVTSFAVFGSTALARGFSGDSSCGCFGRWSVNPFLTAALDSALVLLLVCCRPKVRLPGQRQRVVMALAIWLAVGLPAALAMGKSLNASGKQGDSFGHGRIALLKPETWTGNVFPLLGYIDIGRALQSGEWRVILYHHDCPKCREVIAGYERSTKSSVTAAPAARIALIEMPPYANLDRDQRAVSSRFLFGRLSREKDWFVTTPVEIALKDGVVVGEVGD